MTVSDSPRVACVLLIVSGLLFAPVLGGYFLADDFNDIYDMSRAEWRNLPWMLALGWPRAMDLEWRPLWGLAHKVDFDLWGLDPRGYHFSTVAMHVLASALVWRLGASVPGARSGAGLFALAFFMLAPVHEQPVAWLSARGHLLVTIFMLCSVLALRRYQCRGGTWYYAASLASAAAAFATYELAVALPILLVARDAIDRAELARRRSLTRSLFIHVPYWCMLGAYLVLRLQVFGQLGGDPLRSPAEVTLGVARGVGGVWTSPTAMVASWDGPFLPIATLALVVLPLAFLTRSSRWRYVRAALYFGVVWPAVAVLPMMSEHYAQRHYYVASVGPAVALGLASAELLAPRRLSLAPRVGLVGSLLVTHAFLLVSGVVAFAENGRQSADLARELAAVMVRAASEPGAVVAVASDPPDERRVFWEYAFPYAVNPPFAAASPTMAVLPSFDSCLCPPDEWLLKHGTALRQLTERGAEVVYVLEWDVTAARFVSRRLDSRQFLDAGYLSPGGALVRRRGGGFPEPRIEVIRSDSANRL